MRRSSSATSEAPTSPVALPNESPGQHAPSAVRPSAHTALAALSKLRVDLTALIALDPYALAGCSASLLEVGARLDAVQRAWEHERDDLAMDVDPDAIAPAVKPTFAEAQRAAAAARAAEAIAHDLHAEEERLTSLHYGVPAAATDRRVQHYRELAASYRGMAQRLLDSAAASANPQPLYQGTTHG